MKIRFAHLEFRTTTILSAIGAAFIVTAPCPAEAVEFRRSTLGSLDSFRQTSLMAVDNRGRYWTLLSGGGSTTLYRTEPHGSTIVVTPPAGTPSYHNAALTPEGDKIAIVSTRGGSNLSVVYAERTTALERSTGGWTTETIPLENTGRIEDITFTFDPSGRPHILVATKEFVSAELWTLRHLTRNSGGAWISEPALTLATPGAERLSVAATGSIIHAVYFRDDLGDGGAIVYLNRNFLGAWRGDEIVGNVRAVFRTKILLHPITREARVFVNRSLVDGGTNDGVFYRFDSSQSNWTETPVFASMPGVQAGLNDVVFQPDGRLFAFYDFPGANAGRMLAGDPMDRRGTREWLLDFQAGNGLVTVDAAGNPACAVIVRVGGTRDPNEFRLYSPLPESDPNGDGITYLQDVAHGFTFNGVDRAHLGEPGLGTYVESAVPFRLGIGPSLTFRRLSGSTRRSQPGSYNHPWAYYAVSGSDNLRLWGSTRLEESSVTDNGDGTETVVVVRKQRVSGAPQFLRLRLRKP